MGEINNVLISTVKSPLVINAARFALKLFPNAIFHVVSVIRKLRFRFLYIPHYSRIMERLAEEALRDIEKVLFDNGCLTVRRALLYGEPAKEIIKYVSTNSIDLVVVTSSTTTSPPIDVLGSVASKIIAGLKIPTLVYTPFSDKVLDKDRVETIALVAQDLDQLSKIIPLATTIAKRHRSELNLFTMESGELPETTGNFLRSSGVRFKLKQLISSTSEELVNEILRLGTSTDLIIVKRFESLIRRSIYGILARRELELHERVLLGMSPSPIIIV